jgi:prolyl oligopeptidase PreP (S9A serine peptidase family)
MSAKFAARLRAESTAGRPVLLRLDERGHAIGAEDETKARRLADAYAFLFAELK